ncbi:DUF4439 domain-containing protein [Arthrobacter pascens]|uniref:DUF4439 domain-containing protein n=1 Tax=Arthrobacter pascens TaxID=1677 RepID=UPI0027D76D1D|nr:DUF4439 domain-containing protein [Arthrobacter pascens]
MKDDSQEISPNRRYFRYAVFSLTALLVLSLGIALIPRPPAPPAEPPFSEKARAAAFADTVSLRSATLELAGAAGGPGSAVAPAAGSGALDRIVNLLTTQARALMLAGDLMPPGDSSSAPGTSDSPAAGTTPAPTAGTTTATGGTTAGPAGGPSARASMPPRPSSTAELAVALSASGVQRLKDSETADGGMARLLAGAGTAQLLAAQDLAATAGVPADALPAPAPDPGSATGQAGDLGGAGDLGATEQPEATPAPSGTQAGPACAGPVPSAGASAAPSAAASGAATSASLASALSAAVESEQEVVYGYQAALTRLDQASVVPASHLLEQHQELAAEAAAQGRMHCAAVPPQQPGYALTEAFLAAPAAGLGQLEAGTLTVYGDVVALSAGPTRSWAVAALLGAARRTLHWGADTGPLPGVLLDQSELPQLPG